MKKVLSIFMVLPLIFNSTYSIQNKNFLINNKISNNKTVQNIKNDVKNDVNNNGKNKKIIAAILFTLPALAAGLYGANKVYEYCKNKSGEPTPNKTPDEQPNSKPIISSEITDSSSNENNKSSENPVDTSKETPNKNVEPLPNFKEIFKQEPTKISWDKYREYGRLEWQNGCCWLISLLNVLFDPAKKNIYFEYADATIDDIMNYLDKFNSEIFDCRFMCSEEHNYEEEKSPALFGKYQRELYDYLKDHNNLEDQHNLDHIFENFIRNRRIALNALDEDDFEKNKQKLMQNLIFHFVNLRKQYAIGFKARCQIFRAMINYPKDNIGLHSDNHGIQISALLNELKKLPEEFWGPKESDIIKSDSKEQKEKSWSTADLDTRAIENMITGMVHDKHMCYAFANCKNNNDCCKDNASDSLQLKSGGSTHNVLGAMGDLFNVDGHCLPEGVISFNRQSLINRNGAVGKSESKYYPIRYSAHKSDHDYCLIPKYKIENGNIKYIGCVMLSCSITGWPDYFIPTKTGFIQELDEVVKWFLGVYRPEAELSHWHLISEEDLRKNIKHYTVDDEIIKKFNL